MSFLSYVYRNGLWVSIPLFVASAIALVHLIRGVIRVVRQAHLVSVPLVEEQAVEFAETGRVAVCIEGPRFTTLFAKLSYSLIGPDGTEANGRRSWFRPHSSGASKVRMELGRYEIPTPGRHTLHIRGLEPGRGPDGGHRIVFMRPHLANGITRLLGIVLAGMVLIGSVVFSFMRLILGNGGAS